MIAAVVALAALGGAIATAASAFGTGGTKTPPARAPRPHVDLDSLPTHRGMPTDPKERAIALRKEVLILSATGMITLPQARRALHELRETGTLGGHYGAPTMRVRALSTLPPQAHYPADVASFLAHVGELTSSGAPDRSSVRLLRAGLGKGNGEVYGFRNGSGTPCFILTGYAGTCADGSSVARTGLAWLVSSDVFVGLAADDVRDVELTVDGRSVPVTLRNGVAFAELPAGARSGAVTTTRADGTVSSEELPRLDQ